MTKQSRNAQLKYHLAQLEAHAHAAKSQADITLITRKIEQYTNSTKSAHTNAYKFNHTLPIIGLCLSLLCALLYVWDQMNISEDQRTFLLLFSVVSALGCIAIILSAYKRINAVSTLVYARAVAIKAGVERNYDYNPKQYWKELKGTFSLFDRGDEGQAIIKRYSGSIGGEVSGKIAGETTGEIPREITGTGNSIPFTLIEFKYIDASSRAANSGGGLNTMQKQRTTHFRYALLTQFSEFNYLSVNVKRFTIKWDSTNSRFNKLFKIRCANELKAAKFFDPKTVLAFVDDYYFIKSIDVTSAGFVCIELPKDVFPSQVKSPSLKQHKQFLQQLNNPATVPLLEKSKELVQVIHKQHK